MWKFTLKASRTVVADDILFQRKQDYFVIAVVSGKRLLEGRKMTLPPCIQYIVDFTKLSSSPLELLGSYE